MMVVNDSSDMKLTVTLVVNATFSLWESPANVSSEAHQAAVAILGVLSVLSFILNASISIAVCTSYSIKRSVINLCVFGISIACMIEAGLNVPLSVALNNNHHQAIGSKLCSVSVVTTMFVALIISWEVAVLCNERWSTISKKAQTQGHANRHVFVRISAFIICSVLTFPFALGITTNIPHRLSCCVSKGKSFYYILSLLGVLVALHVFSIATITATCIKAYKEKRNVEAQWFELSYTERFFEESYIRSEWMNMKFVLFILFFHVILQMPYVATQFYLPIYSKYSGSVSKVSSFRWLLYSKVHLGSVFLKYTFPCVFPILVLIERKDILRRCQTFMVALKGKNLLSNSDFECRSIEEPLTDMHDEVRLPRRRRKSTLTYFTTIRFADRTATERATKSEGSNGHGVYEIQKRLRPRMPLDPSPNKCRRITDFGILRELTCGPDSTRYHDITEEEIDSSGAVAFAPRRSPLREVAAQTLLNASKIVLAHAEVNTCQDEECAEDKSVKDSSEKVKDSSYTLSRSQRYRTYPNSRDRDSDKSYHVEGLLSVLRMKRPGQAPCVMLPRSTAEVLDAISDSRDAVSL